MRLNHLIISTFVLWGSLAFDAFADQPLQFTVLEGSYTATTLLCPPGVSCEPYSSSIVGSVTANIKDGVQYTDSDLLLENGSSFVLHQIPPDAETSYSFQFDGEILHGEGIIDTSPMDGPVIEYSFVAKIDQPAEFSPNDLYFVSREAVACAPGTACNRIFVRAANQRYMNCGNGQYARICTLDFLYIGDMGFSPFYDYPFGSDVEILVRGTIEAREFDSKTFLRAKEAFLPATLNPPQNYAVGLQQLPINCVTTPCNNIQQYFLNNSYTAKITSVDLNGVGASLEKITTANQLITDGNILLATGKNQRYWSFRGIETSFHANQFYLRARTPYY